MITPGDLIFLAATAVLILLATVPTK